MGLFARLVREITPNWLHPRSHEAADTSLPDDADESWQEAIDRKMYGADTSDYSLVPEQPVSDAERPTGDRPENVKTIPREKSH